MMKHAVLVVDLQKEYLATGKLPLVNIDGAVSKAEQVLTYARQQNIPVIHVLHESSDPTAPLFTPNTDGVTVITQVAPINDEVLILKNYPNSFLKTNLLEVLKQQEITDLTIIGAMSHMCIDATTRAASDLDFKCTVIEDACATMDLEFDGKTVSADQVHATLMAALAFAYAEVKTTAEFVK